MSDTPDRKSDPEFAAELERARERSATLRADYDADKPVRLSDELERIFEWGRKHFGPIPPAPPSEPAVPCTECSEPTKEQDGRCWKCTARAERIADALETIPPRYRWASLVEPFMANRVRIWPSIRAKVATCEARARNIVLRGAAGCGKTSVLAALVRAELEVGRLGVRWVAARDLATTRAQHDLGEVSSLESMAMSCRVLALDDLGNDRRTQLSAVDDVILERHDRELVTWTTTALSPDELTARYGAGVARRIYEGALVLDLGAPKGTT